MIKYLSPINSYQLKVLGIGWPPTRGWIQRLVGTDIPHSEFALLSELRGPKRKADRIEILKRYGYVNV